MERYYTEALKIVEEHWPVKVEMSRDSALFIENVLGLASISADHHEKKEKVKPIYNDPLPSEELATLAQRFSQAEPVSISPEVGVIERVSIPLSRRDFETTRDLLNESIAISEAQLHSAAQQAQKFPLPPQLTRAIQLGYILGMSARTELQSGFNAAYAK